jgi:hypothetical protein
VVIAEDLDGYGFVIDAVYFPWHGTVLAFTLLQPVTWDCDPEWTRLSRKDATLDAMDRDRFVPSTLSVSAGYGRSTRLPSRNGLS